MASLFRSEKIACWLAISVLGCSANESRFDASALEDSNTIRRRISAPAVAAKRVRVEAQTAENSASPPKAEPGPCPTDMVLIASKQSRTCIDRYEASLVRLADDGSREIHPYFERPRADRRYAAVASEGVFPQAYISRDEALSACQNAGKRLCSRTEWQRACRQGGRAVYPYGNHRQPGVCNDGKRHLLPLLFPAQHYRYEYEAHFNSPELAKQPGFLAPTGSHAGCASELGVHDMVGNLHEWVSDPVGQTFLASFEVESKSQQWQPAHVGNGMFVGGFYSSNNEHGAGCGYTTVAHDPGYHDYSTGFRCCAEPN